MKKINPAIAFYCCILSTIIVIAGCNKNDPTPAGPTGGSQLYKIYDSLNAAVYDTFVYNSNNKLTKFISVGNGAYADTFLYTNNNLTHSQYNGGTDIRFATPYAKTDYQYQNNVLVSSQYYLGTTLITSSAYTFDNAGRLSQVTQTDMGSRSPGVSPTYTTRYEYDANSNLSKIYYRTGTGAETLLKEFLNYDDKPNPYYGLPPTFDYDIFGYNYDKLSKNNVGIIKTYPPAGTATDISVIEYNSDGRVSKRKILHNGLSSGTKYFLYK